MSPMVEWPDENVRDLRVEIIIAWIECMKMVNDPTLLGREKFLSFIRISRDTTCNLGSLQRTLDIIYWWWYMLQR